MAAAEIIIVGGGVAGVHTANLLERRLRPGTANIKIVDLGGLHIFQPGWLYLALDRANSRWLIKDIRSLIRPSVELVVDEATRLDPAAGKLHLARAGAIPYDYLVIATGARLDRTAVPGLAEGTHDFYSMAGAERLREALRTFRGGDIVVGVAGMPYKCPPTPVEFAFLLDDYLRKRGIRDDSRVRYLSPLNRVLPVESASRMIETILTEREITMSSFVNIEHVDPVARRLVAMEGDTFPYDLAVLVPPHRGSKLVEDSGLGDAGGWVPTEPTTLKVKGYRRLFALGDATDLPISKSGSTAHFESKVVAEQITADVEGRDPDPDVGTHGGKVTCFLEVGRGKATILVFDYESPPRIHRPSRLLHFAKWAFNRAYWITLRTGLGFKAEWILRRL
jgi:sulfide:quinone oxidoreductase